MYLILLRLQVQWVPFLPICDILPHSANILLLLIEKITDPSPVFYFSLCWLYHQRSAKGMIISLFLVLSQIMYVPVSHSY